MDTPARRLVTGRSEHTWLPDVGAAIILAGVLGIAVVIGVLDVAKGDVFIYRSWGNAIVDGGVPYRDVAIEYPPGALPLFIAPALVPGLSFGIAFVGMMLATAGVLLAAVRRVASELQRCGDFVSFPRLAAAIFIVILGSVAVSRFDLVPAVLTVISPLLVSNGRHRLGGLALGAGIAVKLYPAIVLPLVVTYVVRRAGRRAGVVTAALALVVVAAAYVPFVLLAWRGVRYSLSVQLARSLEIESLGGALFVVVHRTFGIPLSKQGHYYDFPGHTAHLIGLVSVAIALTIIAGLWIAHARMPASRASLIRYSAATVAAYVAFGKVLSPQYLLWLVPLVPLVAGRRGRVATVLLGLACVFTAVAYPHLWDPELLVDLAPAPLAIIVIRDLLLVGLCAVLAFPATSRSRGRAYSNGLELAVPAE